MRIENSLKNMIFGLSGQITSAIMGIIVRTVFISTLGVEYLGVNGLFTNILILLSVANLGFDTAIIYNLYKPLAEGNQRKIQGFLNLYKKAYQIIGFVIFMVGLLLLPFLSHLMNGATSIQEIKLIYILFLINSVSSYFLVYKQSIIIADQHNHIISKIHTGVTIISNLVQILLLLTTKNFIVVLALQITMNILKNVYISHKANRLYPYIKEKNNVKLSYEEKKGFFKNLYSLMLYKISGVVINGTDNLIISSFFGLYWVGIYSNYLLIIATINTFVSQIFYSITASVGNLVVKENEDRNYFVFRIIQFLNFWVYGFCSICLWNLINPTITIWLGENYVMSTFIVFFIILDFYTSGMQNATTTFRETTGLFQKGKYRPVYAALINIAVSIILANKIGIAGVLLGTVISRLCTYFWYDPFVIFKYAFQKPVRTYFLRYFGFGILVFSIGFIINYMGNTLELHGQMNLIIRAILCLIIPNVFFFILFRKSEEFTYLYKVALSLSQRLPLKRFQKKVESL
ncbi:lipopolysaccharide biosynthesis protein [Paenibacillus sp. Root444D2]|uniref:lipopolysaccharide biosynthesis protein n=1 Tax=Paenibacillus sp. Root444D2 TaxID=1736538 RepID=UPI00070C7338|nr:sugar translocase [Paenibacillus sp. Root444D2]KQX52088.1 sugar translocase [Paenibacillus sp. Root444D2]